MKLLRGWLKTLSYWLRTHTYDRYHIVDLRCPDHGLGYRWGWIDCPEAVLISCFELLKRFMEQEFNSGIVDWYYDKEHAEAARELRELHRWWTVERLDAHDAQDAASLAFSMRVDLGAASYASDEFKIHCARADLLEEQDDIMLGRLMRVRRYMWT